MLICLTRDEVRLYADEIKKEFEKLLNNPRLARGNSQVKQWAFLRHCFNVLMGEASAGFEPVKTTTLKHYTHEVTNKLRRHYSKPRLERIRFMFWLEADGYQDKVFDEGTDYPCSDGYLLLVIPADPKLKTTCQIRGVLARAIDDAIHAEFYAYNSLPEKDPASLKDLLKDYFEVDGAAYRQIIDSIEEHRRHNEIISNRGNPSTRPQLRRVIAVESDGQTAKVEVEEYWNLHWFSTKHRTYVKIYHGKNTQPYLLVKRGDRWYVKENPYSPPRKTIFEQEYLRR